MNLKMQNFFRQWYEADPTVNADAAFVDQSQIEIMTRLNAELREQLDDAALKVRFQNNVDLMRELMYEITERVKRTQPQIETDIPANGGTENHLEMVFEVLNI